MGHHHHHDHSHDHHGHGHGHHHHHAPAEFNKAFAIAVVLNFALVIIQAIYAVLAHSMSLLADAGHNLGDVLGLVMAWFASWLLTKKSTERFSYGYKRTTILAAIANAMILIATSAIIAYESIHKLLHPAPVGEVTVMVVAAIGILVNGGTALLFMRGAKDDLNIKGAFMHLAGDALISLGVVIGAAVILFTGWLWVDPIIGLLIVVMIVMGTWGLLKDSVALMLDAVPRHIDVDKVKAYLKNIPGVYAIHDFHIWGLSTKENAMTAHITMPEGQLTDADYDRIAHDLKHDFKISHITIQVERGSDQDHPCAQDPQCH